MAYGKNGSAANESAPPKKADIILKVNQEISSKQDEIIRQTKLSNSRMETLIETFSKDVRDMAFVTKQSSEIFNRLQTENASLKQELLYLAKQNENIYSGLAEQIAELSARLDKVSAVSRTPVTVSNLTAEIDYDKLAEKVAGIIGVREDVSPDYIASKVAEQIVVPEQSVDEEKLVSDIVSRLNLSDVRIDGAFDEEELADAIAVKAGSLKAEDFEILVDDEGCASISEEIAKRLDLSNISQEIAEKLRAERELFEDKDDVAERIAEKLIKAREDENIEITFEAEEIAQIARSVSDELAERSAGLLEKLEADVAEIKRLIESGAAKTCGEFAAAEAVYGDTIVTVSDIVPEEDTLEDEEQEEHSMPDVMAEPSDGVDFAGMMKYNRSFIARIIQSSDDTKRYYGALKHALLSYKKVNSNVAWGAERFNKGRETIARLKIRGKTLCLYLALNPDDYKTSVYHHTDVSDNKSVSGTPMMVKVKSPLGVKKALRLIDEMLEKREGVKRAVPERDYAAMYPYETIEQLIEDGLVKDIGGK